MASVCIHSTRNRLHRLLHPITPLINLRHYRSNLLPTHTRIKMPSLGDGNESGEISKWHKKIGDRLEVDDPLCEIEMHDMTIELEADEPGYLAEICIAEGIEVKSGTTVARQVSTEDDLTVFINARKSSRETAVRDLVFAYRICADLGFDDYININHISVSIPSSPTTPWKKVMITGKEAFCWHNITKRDLREIEVEEVLNSKSIKTAEEMKAVQMMDIYCSLVTMIFWFDCSQSLQQFIPTIDTIFRYS